MFGGYIPGLDEAVGTIGGIVQNYQNRKLAQQANDNQAALLAQQNAYNSAEAEKQRTWEAEMSNTAYQRARADMEKAGINPILLGGGAEAASTPQGYAANSAASHAQHVPNMVNFIQAGINNGYAANKQMNDNINTAVNAISKLGAAFG